DACEITLDEATDAGHDRPFRVGTVKDDSFAILTRRVLPDGGIEIGSVGKGPAAVQLTRRMADSMHRFHADHRGGEVGFDWWPGSSPDDLPATMRSETSVLPRPHGTLTVTWPAAGSSNADVAHTPSAHGAADVALGAPVRDR